MIPGVSITIPSGLIGSAPQVRVRGTSTVIGNASPVWVIDGIIQEDPLPFAGAQLNDILSSGDLNSAMASISGSSISGLNPDAVSYTHLVLLLPNHRGYNFTIPFAGTKCLPRIE